MDVETSWAEVVTGLAAIVVMFLFVIMFLLLTY